MKRNIPLANFIEFHGDLYASSYLQSSYNFVEMNKPGELRLDSGQRVMLMGALFTALDQVETGRGSSPGRCMGCMQPKHF